MPSTIATDDDNPPKKDEDQDAPDASPAAQQDANSTPVRKPASSKPKTPASAPAQTRSGGKKPEPTLLTDFLLGRPSPARQRRRSLDVVKAEMRQAAVNKVPAPGGVKERVKQWQKANAAAVAQEPDATTSEPDEVLVQVEEGSVNEEDRIRIKLSNTRPPIRRRSKVQQRGSLRRARTAPRKRVVSDEHWRTKRSTPPKGKQPASGAPIPKDFLKVTAVNPPVEVKIKDWMKRGETTDGEPEKSSPSAPKQSSAPRSRATSSAASTPKGSLRLTASNPPVEDKIKDWAKRTITPEGEHKKVTPPKEKQPKVSSGTPLPKNFLKVTAMNPSVETKMKDWMKRVEAPDTTEVEERDTQAQHIEQKDSSSKPTKLKPKSKQVKEAEITEVDHDKDIQVKPKQTKDLPSASTKPKPKETKNISTGAIPKDFLKTTAMNPPVESKIKDWIMRTEDADDEPPKNKELRGKATEKKQTKEKFNRYPSRSDPGDEGVKDTPAKSATRSSGCHENYSTPRQERARKEKAKDIVDHKSQKQRLRTSRMTPDDSDRKSSFSEQDIERDSHVEEDATSCTTPSPPGKSRKRHVKRSESVDDSLSEIPFGHSAFSVLDMPLGAEAGTMRRPKPQRNGSLSVPKVLKKVYNEGLKMVHDTVDPPKVEINQPPSIESWLNQTTDPFLDRPSSSQGLKEAEHPLNEASYPVDTIRDEPISGASGEASRDYSKRESHHRKSTPRQKNEFDESGKHNYVTGRSKTQLPIDADRDLAPAPLNLKRSPATRHSSSPIKTTRKLPFRDVLLEAFKGESAIHGPNPLADLKDPQWEEIDHIVSNQEIDDLSDISEETCVRYSPKPEATTSRDNAEKKEDSRPKRSRQASDSSSHRLSTIASLETLNTIPENISRRSLTERRQDTFAKPTTTSKISRRSANRNGPRRRLTKHSDLISVLSLPDSAGTGRARSIKSARSIRTTRTDLETATVRDLLKELAEDEAKYMRELRTLVDGVIPVLLNMVLSRSNSIVSASVLTPEIGTTSEERKKHTRDICAMGVALEKLKSHHKRIPLVDVEALTTWLDEVYEVYEDYLSVWRLEYRNVVINLAPASKLFDNQSLLDGMARNEDGDIVDSNGERVDVAFLLKRPLVRVKYLSKVTKGLKKLKPSERSDRVMNRFNKLHNFARQRTKEEIARLEDHAANDIDPTRARDPRTLAQVDDVRIDRSRQVCAKDFFSLDLSHSSGQRIECRVEIILRDKPSDSRDSGDVLICKVEEFNRYLLFPPIAAHHITAQHGGEIGQLILVIRGKHGVKEWQETLDLETDDTQTIDEWINMLASAERKAKDFPTVEANTSHDIDNTLVEVSRTPSVHDVEIPIGERRQTESVGSAAKALQRAKEFDRLKKKDKDQPLSTVTEAKRPRPTRYHNRVNTLSVDLSRKQEQGQDTERLNPETPKETRRSVSLTDIPDPEYHAQDERPTSSGSDYSDLPVPDRAPPPPPPPAHKTPPSNTIKNVPQLTTPNPRVRTRRTSSPLKHEYQPSDASGTSSASDISDSESSHSDEASAVSDSSDDEELEAVDLPRTVPAISLQTRRASPIPSTYSAPEDSLAPSNSASQGPYHRPPPKEQSPTYATNLKARLSSWSNRNARWEDLHPDECVIVINAGLIEAFEIPPNHDENEFYDFSNERPLVALVLTPLVSLRQSNAVDIEIKSPPTHMSRLKWEGPVRYRTSDFTACQKLYQAIHRARLDNPIYKKLEQERMLNSYGGHSYEAAVATNRRLSWLGRRRSYRASTRAPEGSITSTPNSITSSAFSVLKRLTGSSRFDINKSSIDTSQGLHGIGSGHNSVYTSSAGSTASGITPPRTPTTPSLAGTTASHIINRSSENLKIRLYLLATRSKWEDLGSCLLTVTQPPPGMRQASSLYHGIERRVVVRTNTKKSEDSTILLDVVLGGRCFQRVGRTGVLVNVWEDIIGPNGEIGMIGAVGGVSGRTRKWLLQSGNSADADWIFGLVAAGR